MGCSDLGHNDSHNAFSDDCKAIRQKFTQSVFVSAQPMNALWSTQHRNPYLKNHNRSSQQGARHENPRRCSNRDTGNSRLQCQRG
jgi:hypothetical protein